MTVVVATIKAGGQFNRTRFERKLDEAGWIDTTGGNHGFSMPLSTTAAPGIRMCRGQDLVTYQLLTIANGDQLLRIAVGKEPQRPCSLPGARSFSDLSIPALFVPPAVRIIGTAGGGSPDSTHSQSHLVTTMTAQALAEHFVPQLIEAGWKLESGPTSDGVMSVTRLSGKSKAGDPVTGLLILTAFPGTTHVDAMIRFVCAASRCSR